MSDGLQNKFTIKASKSRGPRKAQGGLAPASPGGGKTLSDFLKQKGLPSLAEQGSSASGTELHVEGGRRYIVGRTVAQGGMGIIYEAYDVNLQRTVAMKVLPRDLPFPSDDLLRFVEEARITSQLEHPSIVPLHDMGLDAAGNIFYTMKYVEGMTLTDILLALRRGDPNTVEQFPLVRMLQLFQKVCDAVAFAHSRLVIHRDLKPDNVMVGNFGEVQVMDWGLAKRMPRPSVKKPRSRGASEKTLPVEVPAGGPDDDDDISSIATISSSVLGSPGFMSPEQARGVESRVGPRSDIYSLGAILYSILTLRPSVVVRNDPSEALRKVVAGDIRAPAEYNHDNHAAFPHCPGGQIPQELSDLAMKCMATDPAARYGTVQHLQADIEDFLEGRMWHLVLDDHFSKPDVMSRWKVFGGEWDISDGELRVRNGEPQLVLLRRDLPGDVCIEFECYQDDSYLNDVGCFLSAVRTDNDREIWSSGYEFKLGAYDNSTIVLMRSDQKLWHRPASPVARGKILRVRAERVGSRLRLVVNGEEIFNIVDRDPLTGSDRVAVGLLGWRASTRYRWVRLYTLGTPWRSDPVEVAERQLNKGHYATAMDLFEDVIESFPDAERLDRAKRGYEIAWHRHEMARNLPAWKAQLEKAWPGVPVQLRMANDGLSVEISNAGITDLAPLAGLPLTALYCAQNRITSLEPIRGVPLITLNCSGNPIESLDPLRGMPLTILLCENCRIGSLEPLRNMKLVTLNCGGNRVESLSPLAGMPLTFLSCWDNRVRDLEPIRGMPLASLIVAANNIRDLEPVRGMSLNMLHCGGNPIRNLEPLRGMRLDILHFGDSEVESLEPLRGQSPSIISAHCARITSLEPLSDVSIRAMTCGGNPLSDLGPFSLHPPEDFHIDAEDLPIQELRRVRDLWRDRPDLGQLRRELETCLALREGDSNDLRDLAQQFNGHRYLFIPRFMKWAEARVFCEGLGGHLVTITTAEEDRFVASMFEGGCWVWMGLETMESGQHWVTGEPFNYGSFVDINRERRTGPKVFSRRWYYDHVPDAHNCFVIEWDE